MPNIQASDNIQIQNISNGNMTLNVNGQEMTIHQELAELKELLKNQNVSNITYENKIYNIEHINEANFGVVTSNKVFNGVLTRELLLLLSNKEKPASFIATLPEEDKENWEGIRQHLKDAQGILEDSFVWVIGWELRRLFSIGNDKAKGMDNKIDEYINHCFKTYRISLQLIVYVFIAKLWDEKNMENTIDSNKVPIKNFFSANRLLKLSELRATFQTLIEIFKTNQLSFPIDEKDLGDLNEFLKVDSAFNSACIELEKLEAKDLGKESYGLGHCHTAEISLTTILSKFKFFTNYQLVTLKKIEYEQSRNSAARYIKDLNFLEKKESSNQLRLIKYDNAPALTYSVLFRNEKYAVNLFPFLLDYNALTNESDFQLFFYECRESESDLRFFSIKNETDERISFLNISSLNMKITSEDQKNELQKNIRLDLVPKQFEEAMTAILGTAIAFKPKGATENFDSLGNI